MNARLYALRYILQKASKQVETTRLYIDGTLTTGLEESDKAHYLIQVAREIIEEAIKP
jgi:hypothetical protein